MRNSLKPAGVLAIAFLLLVSSCEGGATTVTWPVARTPELLQVDRLVVGQPRQTVTPNTRGQYEALPAVALIVRTRAPYPLKAQVSIDDEVLEENPDPARKDELEKAGKAYFIILEIVPDDLFEWQFQIMLPPALRTVPGFALTIKTISYDPNATGQDKVSSPLTLTVVGPCGSQPPLPQNAQAIFYRFGGDVFDYTSTSPNPTELDPCGKRTVVITSVKNGSWDKNFDRKITIDLTYRRPNGSQLGPVRLKPTEETNQFNGLPLDNNWDLRVQFVNAVFLDNPASIRIEIGWKPQ